MTTTTKTFAGRYSVISSAMQPNGSYAKTTWSGSVSHEEATHQFNLQGFVGPDGKSWGHQVSLMYRSDAGERKTLAIRHF